MRYQKFEDPILIIRHDAPAQDQPYRRTSNRITKEPLKKK
jgi:hypothetical protein